APAASRATGQHRGTRAGCSHAKSLLRPAGGRAPTATAGAVRAGALDESATSRTYADPPRISGAHASESHRCPTLLDIAVSVARPAVVVRVVVAAIVLRYAGAFGRGRRRRR